MPSHGAPSLGPTQSVGITYRILQVKKLRPRDVKYLGQSHTAGKDPKSIGLKRWSHHTAPPS